MSINVEEIDQEGRSIYFQSFSDASKGVVYRSHEINSHEKVNKLFESDEAPSPKFRGYVFAYAPFFSICAASEDNNHKVKQKIEYDAITGLYPCDSDDKVLFMVVEINKGQSQLRIFRLPSCGKATRMRFTVDQLQLAPSYLTNTILSTKMNPKRTPSSGFSSQLTEESIENQKSVFHSAHHGKYELNAAFGTSVQDLSDSYNSRSPRMKQYTVDYRQGDSGSLSHNKRTEESGFHSTEFRIYRPSKANMDKSQKYILRQIKKDKISNAIRYTDDRESRVGRNWREEKSNHKRDFNQQKYPTSNRRHSEQHRKQLELTNDERRGTSSNRYQK